MHNKRIHTILKSREREKRNLLLLLTSENCDNEFSQKLPV